MKQLIKKVTFLCMVTVVLTACKKNYTEEKGFFINPVIHGDLADPSIIRIDDFYYATGTSSEWAPFYPVFVSYDLVNWEQTGHIFTNKPEWTSSSFWAPELYYHNDKVYCYYTARRQSDHISYIGVAVANSPTEEFTDHGLLIEYGTEAIDAFVYNDEGKLYITWKAYGLDERPIEILGCKLSDDGLQLEGEPFTILVDDEHIGMEGQYHFKKGEYYYMIYSSRGCCGPDSDYDVCVARAKNFKGPYEKYSGNPILHGGKDYISCGHGTAVTTPDGRMFYLCHAYLKNEGFYQGRQAILQEMAVNEEGWVYFVTGSEAQRIQPMPYAGTKVEPVEDIVTPYKWWTWNYPYADVELLEDGKKVILTGTPKEGNLYGSVACIRSTSPTYVYETKISNNNSSFKGLTMYGDDKNLVAWGRENKEIILKVIINGKEEIIQAIPSTNENTYLKIEVTEGCLLSFWRSSDGDHWEMASSEITDFKPLVRWDRVPRPGVIHIGQKEVPAVFEYFTMKNL